MMMAFLSGDVAGEDEGIRFKPVEAQIAPAAETPATDGWTLAHSTDVFDLDVITRGLSIYILAGGDRNLRLYEAGSGGEVIKKPVTRAANRGRTVHLGFLPELNQDGRLWFYVTSQISGLNPSSTQQTDLGFMTTFYAWDGKRIRKIKYLTDFAYRRFGPVLVSQRILNKKPVWGPIQTVLAQADADGELTLHDIGPMRLPAGACLYDFERADINSDGSADYVFAEGDAGVPSVYLSGDGNYPALAGRIDAQIMRMPAEIKTPHGSKPHRRFLLPIVSDIDGDGLGDILTAADRTVKQDGYILFNSKHAGYSFEIHTLAGGTWRKQFETDRIAGDALVFRWSADGRLITAYRSEDGKLAIRTLSEIQ